MQLEYFLMKDHCSTLIPHLIGMHCVSILVVSCLLATASAAINDYHLLWSCDLESVEQNAAFHPGLELPMDA